MPILSISIADPPPLRVLPFHSDAFAWERFETFCLDVISAQPDVVHAEPYGVPGGRQKGIDFVATLTDGRRRTVQARHRKRFARADAERVIRETSYQADEHEVWVTARIGDTAADVLDGHDGWSYRSDEGISHLLRAMPPEIARRIIDRAFGPAVRRAFLGQGGMVGFDATQTYFEPFDRPGRLIRHDLALIGRDDELAALLGAVARPESHVVVQPGRGGIGKTRLLRSLAHELEVAQGIRVLFARAGVELTAAVVDELPLEPVVVIVEDAHRADVGLASLLGETARRAELTIVLTTRPAGVEAVVAAATDAGLEPAQVALLPQLRALKPDDVTRLAEAAAGQANVQTRRLADATAESPLITVIGGGLLAREELGPATDEELRRSVLARFSREQLGGVTPRVPEAEARALATLVAALAPLNVEDQPLLQLIAQELDTPPSQVRRWLGELEAAGLVLARGRYRRLTPDVLADELLLEACVDPAGRPTGYADELWSRYSAAAPASLLANLSELDWRPHARGTSLLDAVWANLEDRFRDADAWGREQLLDVVARAAYYVPERALKIVKRALSEPARPVDWSGVGVITDDDSVRAKLPAILRAIAQHPKQVRGAMSLLWELGRDDPRPLHSHPDHPVRTIRELGGYGRGTSYKHNEALLAVAEGELAKPGADEHHHLPIELVGPLLERDGTTSEARGRTIQMGSYNVSAEGTKPWRERIRALLVTRALHGSPRERMAVAKLFDEALGLPHGYFGNAVDPEARDSWHADQNALLTAIAEIEAASTDAALRDALANAINWHAEHDPWPDTRTRAGELLGRLAGADEELIAVLAHPWDLLDEDATDERTGRVAARLIGRYPDPAELAGALNAVVSDLARRSQHAVVVPLLGRVSRESQDHARGLWAWAVEHPDAELTVHTCAALDELRRAGTPVSDLLREGWDSGESILRRAVAAYLQMGAWFTAPESTELELLEACVADTDPDVLNMTRVTLLRLGKTDRSLAARLAVRIPAASGHEGDAVFAALHEADLSTLDTELLDALLDRLVAVPELGHFACEVVADLATVDLERWMEVWRRRLEHEWDTSGDSRYRGVPYRDSGADLLRDVPPTGRHSALRSLLSLASKLEGFATRELGRLYWRVGIPDADDIADEPPPLEATRAAEALAAFGEWAVAAETDGDTVVELLFELPWQVVLEQPTWVRELLTAVPGKRCEELMGGLHAAVFSGVYGSTRIARIAETSARLAATEPLGTPARELYEALERAATSHQERERRHDEELDGEWR